MVKRSKPPSVDVTLKLLRHRDEVEEKIQKQIARGKELLLMPSNSSEEYQELTDAEDIWISYTEELLLQLFSKSSLSQEFVWAGPPIVMGGFGQGKSRAEEIQSVHRNIRDKCVKLKSIKERVELLPVSQAIANVEKSTKKKTLDMNKVFIVHGHDDAAKESAARFIEKLDLQPIILHEQSSSGDTIIEKIERYSDVGFGVILYTECDVGSVKSDVKNLKNRARQNVIFEHGYLIGKLSRKNVCALVKGQVETPNDISGVVYVGMNDDSWKLELAKELKQAGYEIDMNKLFE